jgi:hypothetical protein
VGQQIGFTTGLGKEQGTAAIAEDKGAGQTKQDLQPFLKLRLTVPTFRPVTQTNLQANPF